VWLKTAASAFAVAKAIAENGINGSSNVAIDPINRSFEQNFEAEKLIRTIRDCSDVEQLRELALMLVTRLSQQQATSRWLAERSSEAENKHLEAVARLIDQNGQGWPDLNPSEKN